MTLLGLVYRPTSAPELLRETARTAERTGVDELWLWEDTGEQGALAAAATALACTERLHVGLGVLPVPLRNVALTGMELATLLRLYPERVQIGLGHGVLGWMERIGARVESPMTLLREYVGAIRGLLDGERVTTAGRYVSLDDIALRWPPATRPPLHLGAVRPRTIALAGELADGVVLTGGTTPQAVAEARRLVDEARGDREGRGRVTVFLVAVTGADAPARYAAEMATWGLDPSPEVGVCGTPEDIAAAVRRWAEAGADAVVLQPTVEDDPTVFARVMGEQVMPLLRGDRHGDTPADS